ncbi:protein dpy-30 homolog [Hydra vulgaris]|uniref:Protein dpy-30 homolog n=1 Tax=Hydra vulgaris TaxID=6087 RepID=A0ABM4CKI3_HYDVU
MSNEEPMQIADDASANISADQTPSIQTVEETVADVNPEAVKDDFAHTVQEPKEDTELEKSTENAHKATNEEMAELLSEKTKKVVNDEREAATKPKSKVEIQSLPTRQYLDQSIVPILLQGLTAIAKERPAEPIDFLAAYLMKNKHLYQS